MSRQSLLLTSAALGLALAMVLILGLAFSAKTASAVHTEALLTPIAGCGGFGSDDNDVTGVWRSSVIMEQCEPRAAVTSTYYEELWGVPDPYTFYLNHLGDRLDSLSLSWTGAGNCLQRSDSDVFCTGYIGYLNISYRCHFTPLVESGGVHFDFSPPSRIDSKYELALFYLPRLVFITSTIAPPDYDWAILPNGNHALYWYPFTMQDFETRVTFSDAGIKFLPLIAKDH